MCGKMKKAKAFADAVIAQNSFCGAGGPDPGAKIMLPQPFVEHRVDKALHFVTRVAF